MVQASEENRTMMRSLKMNSSFQLVVLLVAISAASAFAQTQNQYPQGPSDQQQQPPSQYPPQGQYPAPQPQYPQAQGQYPPQQEQYPAPGQYPAPQGGYPPQGPPPPALASQQLDQLVGPVALYPDGLLAQVLTAATYSYDIADAAGWATNINTYEAKN